MNLNDIKAAVKYSETSSGAFTRKWAAELSPEVNEFLGEFQVWYASRVTSTKSPASAKSLTARFLATGELSQGKSGDSQKSYLRKFLNFVEQCIDEGVEVPEELLVMVDDLEESANDD